MPNVRRGLYSCLLKRERCFLFHEWTFNAAILPVRGVKSKRWKALGAAACARRSIPSALVLNGRSNSSATAFLNFRQASIQLATSTCALAYARNTRSMRGTAISSRSSQHCIPADSSGKGHALPQVRTASESERGCCFGHKTQAARASQPNLKDPLRGNREAAEVPSETPRTAKSFSWPILFGILSWPAKRSRGLR